ncbi:MAG: PHP domain-containing protein [Pelotomaculum sp.]|jgi:predicted metal-dependent phosphoesterase TrpH
MFMEVDLHVHTVYSDGTDSPEKIVATAKSIGLSAVAITDHDTVEGIGPAMAAARKYNLEIIPGVELSTEYKGQELHILGYLIDAFDRNLLSKLSSIRQEREQRMEKMVGRLQALGFSVDLDRIRAISGAGAMGRPHLAAVMVEAGIVKTKAEAFDLYIGHGKKAFVHRAKLTPSEAIRMIHDCAGVAVLAHPGLNSLSIPLEKLIDDGIIGLEAYHPAHNRELASYYERLAAEKGLIVTGGSDYHGPGRAEESRLGLITVPYKVVEKMKRLQKQV